MVPGPLRVQRGNANTPCHRVFSQQELRTGEKGSWQQLYLTQQHPLSFVTHHAGSRKASATFQSEAVRICLLTHVKVASNCSPKTIPLEGNV